MALVLVLAFLVLLTGLLVAFFSSSVLYRQISNSSASETKVALFAQGAVNTIIGDLQQEIAAGSNTTFFTDVNGNVAGQVYQPFNANTAVPAQALQGPSSEQSGIISYAPNLVKRSAYSQTFFPSGSGTNYNNGNTSQTISVSGTPSTSPPAAPTYSPSNRAANIATNIVSQNGRAVTLARWNKALLLPKANSNLTNNTDSTPINPQNAATGPLAPAAAQTNEFVAPDWVLVARNGSNPASSPTGTFNSNMVYSATGTSSVIGRYAYTVYDEGGLLDANVAGYPTNTSGAADPKAPPYKNALAFADLTQLPGINALASSRQATVINSLVGWRNYATAQPSGTLEAANYNFTGAPLTNFSNAMLMNPHGFLLASNTAPYNSQTDHMFASRQQLLGLMLNGIALQGTSSTAVADQANLQSALQYLGTFSRSVNQPTFTPNATRPRVQAISAGGNDSFQNPAADDKINPPLQSVRVSAGGWTRNDGSIAVVGEPLVKKRFALNRLAWLSYAGAAANNMSNAAVQQTITLLGGNPMNTQDPVYQFVSQGTDDGNGTSTLNIPKYFGLTWDNVNKRWRYIHGISGSSGRIMTLAEVNSANREPDFFELIKASICVGTLGKAYLYNGSTPDPTTPAGYQQQRDNSVDAQVIQIGANIIDQFDCDGYPTRILFSDNSLFGGVPQEYRGIEDLPYIYRIREGKVTLRDSNPSQSNLPAVGTLMDGGLAAILQEAEIWNPHGWNSSAVDPGLRPTLLRIVAISTDPNSASSVPGVVSTANAFSVEFNSLLWCGTHFYMPGLASPGPWNESTTEMDFQIPANMQYLFREPTLLIKPGVPINSNLMIGTGNVLKSVLGTTALTSQWPATQIVANHGSDNQKYIGFLAAYGPVAWAETIPPQGINANSPLTPTPGVVEATSAYTPVTIKGITYRLQYQDPSGSGKWLTYDEKFTNYISAVSYNNGTFWTNQNKTFNTYNSSGSPPTQDNIISTELAETCFDPRTSRFGMQYLGTNGYRGPGFSQFPVRQSVMTLGWAGPSGNAAAIVGATGQMALATMRPDNNAGFQFGGGNITYLSTSPTAPGWFPSPNGNTYVQPGMISQNNTAEAANPVDNIQVTGDGQTIGGPNNQFFADADNVVRRSVGGYVPTNTASPATIVAGQPSGLPLKLAFDFSASPPNPNVDISSRPIVLNRPFRSPAELGYVFSGTPWRNLDMSTPESGAAALMDVFCVNDTDNANQLVAGKVELNTRQSPVLTAVLGGASAIAGNYTGAYKDEFNPTTASTAPTPAPNITATDAANIGAALINLTSGSPPGTPGIPLTNVAELAGKWNSSVNASGISAIDGSKSYGGFSDTYLGQALALNTNSGSAEQRVPRFREAAIRPLASVGQTRTWNLMIDLVAQTGRYPASAAAAANPLAAFIVEGEQRYWIHLAVDRWTGAVVDEQFELVKE